MKRNTIILFAVVAFLCILFGVGCSSYNGLVTESNTVDQAWAQVQNQYQRRADLIPNLVSSVKGYSAHEADVQEKVTLARAGLMSANEQAQAAAQQAPATQEAMDRFQQAQDSRDRALNLYVNAVHEAYPDLKANEMFLNLQTELAGTENRVSTERMRYTQAVQQYNNKVQRFPGSMLASMFGFTVKPQFAASQEAQTAPKVEF